MFSRIIGLSFLLVAFGLVPLAHAQRANSATLTISYAWHDGEREQLVWLDPALVAEFSALPGDESAVKRAFPAAAAERRSDETVRGSSRRRGSRCSGAGT